MICTLEGKLQFLGGIQISSFFVIEFNCGIETLNCELKGKA